MKEKTTVGLALPGAYLASTYTAITEAWFQKVNVVVFAFFMTSFQSKYSVDR